MPDMSLCPLFPCYGNDVLRCLVYGIENFSSLECSRRKNGLFFFLPLISSVPGSMSGGRVEAGTVEPLLESFMLPYVFEFEIRLSFSSHLT